MSKTSLLDLIVKVLPVAQLPELVIYFLAGDVCLDYCDTLEKVFLISYPKKQKGNSKETYLDESLTVRHDFDGSRLFLMFGGCWRYRNGKLKKVCQGDFSALKFVITKKKNITNTYIKI